MMTTPDPPGAAFTRVLVTLTGTGGSRALLETACLAARATDAALAALYVREERLADLAALPFAAVLAPGQGSAEPLTPAAVERAWARAEAACRAALHAIRPAIPAAFEAAAGRLEAVLAGRAGPGDLVVLGMGEGMPPAPSEALVKAVATLAGAVLIVPPARSGRAGPVVAIDDGDPAGAGTVRLAARLATAAGRRAAVLALAQPGAQPALAARARALAGHPIAVHAWPADQAGLIGDALAALAPSMVVADLAGPPFAAPGALAHTLRRLRAPLLLLSEAAARRIAAPGAPPPG
ncbi:MAG: hypothetical protein RQ752_09980 [Thermohalobaculum sp.]|nr:hypothetical protein [Thermohalobaculum sp.]